ncbi:hypothetical protein KVG88_17765 [Pseudomonas sp. SWRI74]|uniref:Secreted protein n=1 Tax=Pseudomonas azerbaijanoccidentalis TaxID=2842347 RepID=A0ABS6QSK1_9PSED|nr:hypothetical protein [Pseudomonas azerbaijanoccidentalis]
MMALPITMAFRFSAGLLSTPLLSTPIVTSPIIPAVVPTAVTPVAIVMGKQGFGWCASHAGNGWPRTLSDLDRSLNG